MTIYRKFETKSSDHKYNAQENLRGLTYYVDDDSLRFHKSKILETCTTDNGLLFGMVESCAADWENKKRVFKPVIFDIFGNAIYAPKLEECFKTKKQAIKDMWQALDNINAIEATKAAIKNHRSYTDMTLRLLTRDLKEHFK